MAEVQFIQYQNIEILYSDFSYSSSREEDLRNYGRGQTLDPPSSVFTLVHITEIYFDRDISQALKRLAVHNKPYVKASAVVGVTTIRKIIYNAVMFFSNRHFECRDDLKSAKEWLLRQSK